MPTPVLSIAGFDGIGGAGLQADLKTFAAFGCHGLSVLTALPVQNTLGVRRCYALPIDAIAEQLDTVISDVRPKAIKIGMLFNAAVIDCVADYLSQTCRDIPIVLDPVMVAQSGDPLVKPDAIAAMKAKMLPLATVITPNLPEATTLLDIPCTNAAEMPAVAEGIGALGPQYVLLKAGHLTGETANDLLYTTTQTHWLNATRIETNNTHGTGCTLSAAIAANIACGHNVLTSAQKAKHYLHQALLHAKDEHLGHGPGPVAHFYAFKEVSC